MQRFAQKIFVFMLIALAYAQRPVPQTFGFMTVTHTRGNDISQFNSYLSRYASMTCPQLTQINIIWNNDRTPQQFNLLNNKQNWLRPVNFYKTPYNSMNWRYKIPPESKAQVFFSIDDDIEVDCQQLKRGFKVWKDNVVEGNIGPIVSYGPRYYQYTMDTGFMYGRKKQMNFFNIALVGLAFISRHFLDLYYLQRFQLIKMREYVKQKNNCDDIGLNWLIQYYYPQLKPIPISGTLLNKSPRIGQATSPTHYPYRTACIDMFTKIFGVNSLRYVPFPDQFQGRQQREIPMMRQNVMNKVRYFQKEIRKAKGMPQQNREGDQHMEEDQRGAQLIRQMQIKISQLQDQLSSLKSNQNPIQIASNNNNLLNLQNTRENQSGDYYLYIYIAFLLVIIVLAYFTWRKSQQIRTLISQQGKKLFNEGIVEYHHPQQQKLTIFR